MRKSPNDRGIRSLREGETGDGAPSGIPIPIFAAAILVAGILAYCTSFWGGFVFDDRTLVTETPILHDLGRLLTTPVDLCAAMRPTITITMAVNYAISGMDSWSYHLFNLVVHLLAGLTLFGILRRTLLTTRLSGEGSRILVARTSCPRVSRASRPQDTGKNAGKMPAVLAGGTPAPLGRHAGPLAATAAAIWVVHPLQTESVAYVIQRAESMMGMFFLLTLYCVIRAASPGRPHMWQALAAVACALGMGTKQVMAVAPLVVLAYDRIFLAASWRELLARRGWMYGLLAATWGILVGMLLTQPLGDTAGFGNVSGISPLAYAATQPGVILHYLRLSVWPAPLCVDYYDWKLASSLWKVALPGAAVALMVALTIGSMRGLKAPTSARAAAGFAGVWFFLILAPTSSIMPIKDLAVEHRMYLPLAAVVTLAVLLAATGWEKVARMGGTRIPAAIPWSATGAVVLMLIFMTASRCTDYFTDLTLWGDAVAKRPQNGRAHFGLGSAYLSAGKYDAALGEFNEALRLTPELFQAWNNRGLAYLNLGLPDNAMRDFDHSLSLRGDLPNAYCNRGRVMRAKGDAAGAIAEFDKALKLDPKCVQAYGLRAGSYLALKKYPEAWADVRSLQRLGATPDKAFVDELTKASGIRGL